MEINVIYNGEKRGTISFFEVPKTVIAAKQMGFEVRWNHSEKELELSSVFFQKNVVIVSEDESITIDEKETAKLLQSFLEEAGINSVILKKEQHIKYENPVSLFIRIKILRRKDTSSLFTGFVYNNKIEKKEIQNCFNGEHTPYIIKLSHSDEFDEVTAPFLDCIAYFPADYLIDEKKFIEEFALYLSYGIIRSILGDHELEVHPRKINELIQLKNDHVQKVKEIPKKETEIKSDPKPKKMETAEVYFDYTVKPQSNNEKYTIIGSLIIKNSGNVDLINPTIGIRITPGDKADFGGQILPPSMVDVLAVQGSEGSYGWQYVGEDWLEKGMGKGEYWIQPIQYLTIAPNETEGLRQFHINFEKLDRKKTIIVEGFVLFQEQNLSFASNNKIIMSF
ncbi:hypothetical protein [Metabacillus arenae]|uniref:Uncharacterized protein n=1 Tax=Metabacillus arenae TaxID=2771434 RepID=A0A926N7U6_9BACI|nr:hypothetical protein [Metabacillus arenae]MBD1378982.1 hypothetical protein [Metabacillus arenae]